MLKFVSKMFGVFGYVFQYGCLTHCTFEYIGDFVVCNGPSMEPTLFSNNVLITERITARLHKVQRGDIIIAKCPTNPSQHVCKRVVGLPGDRIMSPPSAFQLTPFQRTLAKGKDENLPAVKRIRADDVIVPRGHVWLEGDNSENSADSRYYGPVPQGLIKSRAICRLWPFSDIKLLI